ncbi:hypothetical protein OHA98_18375 [Streptomyces sp. NBC_00654]|uniref:hypothetical protein n=1 Tax=Streptomyces sp. NBC_00654 TaxID=2975799 RepID=UPI002253F78C|nr:hypothetical protein [Streptomyces sp. NBC_00654]MCX4966766.1 hypothetical protein [Streptomyces sp. NBC_00654]
MNSTLLCGTSDAVPPRPLTVPEVVVLIVIVVAATVLAVAGLPAISATVLIVEAAALGVRLLRRLRIGATEPGPAEA